MPPLKPKPSDVAVEAKKTYIPYINQKFPQLSPRSYSYINTDKLQFKRTHNNRKLRVAVIDGDPVDVALDWDEYESTRCTQLSAPSNGDRQRIPVVNMANERIPGGDWESGLMASEENFCRRSNLVQCLTAPTNQNGGAPPSYPLPQTAGIYSPYCVVFRAGAENGYAIWSDFKWLPVISVAPVRRPKLNAAAEDYSFKEEKELMEEKIRNVLRIAAAWNHANLCVGAFGSGPTFRNPPQQLARMWRDILFAEPEFQGLFSNVVFAIEKGSASGTAGKPSEHDVFKHELDPSNVYKTSYR